MEPVTATSESASVSVSDHHNYTPNKPLQRIRLIRKPSGARKGYLYACTNGSDRFQVGFSLCHDDKFSGIIGIEIAKKRAKRNVDASRFVIIPYCTRADYFNDSVCVPESIVDDLEKFIDYCKGVFGLKPPRWATGLGVIGVNNNKIN